MNKAIATATGLVAGFIGGAMSHYLFVPMRVQAQAQSPTEVRAQKFVLVDGNGTVRGVFGFRSDGSPDIQIRLKMDKPKGLAKLIEAEVLSVRWMGTDRKSSLADLRPTLSPGAKPPGASE